MVDCLGVDFAPDCFAVVGAVDGHGEGFLFFGGVGEELHGVFASEVLALPYGAGEVVSCFG